MTLEYLLKYLFSELIFFSFKSVFANFLKWAHDWSSSILNTKKKLLEKTRLKNSLVENRATINAEPILEWLPNTC